MKYKPIDPELFTNNRANFRKLLPSDAIAIFHSNDAMPSNGDQTFDFRQNSDLFYLTGVDQADTQLVIFPDCPDENYREALFIQKTSKEIATWEGEKLTKDEAKEATGISNVYWNTHFEKVLPKLMNWAEQCYLNLNENERFSSEVPYKDLRFAREQKEQFPLHDYQRCGPLMKELRTVKSDIEIELIQQACNITKKTLDRVLAFIEPGRMEYEIEAEILHEFIRNRANGYAYHPIVASGKNSCVLHYQDNNQECKDGEVLLMDFGAEYANYASDITRTVPVNGKYTKRQKDVYNAVLRSMKAAKDMLRPGTTVNDYEKEVGKIVEEELIGLGLLDKADVKDQDPDNPLYKQYFMHGTSHYMGLDVHDIGSKYDEIQPGMVFTCEPGIYIPDEEIGVRIENDILVTKSDPIDLTKDMPLEAEAIEEAMREGD
jgi:Xaa-Pro aminopeptidase